MKTIVMGNAGAGKTTLARRLAEAENAARLCLDEIAFIGGTQRRPLGDSVAAAEAFIRSHPRWVIEGCYADIIEPLLTHCETLLFLNPGVETCVRHCLARPWEPDKFSTRAEQQRQLEPLLEWVRLYETRGDEYGLARHQRLFKRFDGDKRELRHPGPAAR